MRGKWVQGSVLLVCAFMLRPALHAAKGANPEKHPETNDALARKFLRDAGLGQGQKAYRTFGIERYGEPLYKDAFAAQKHE